MELQHAVDAEVYVVKRAPTVANPRPAPSLMSGRFDSPSSPRRQTSTQRVSGSTGAYSRSDSSLRQMASSRVRS